MTVFEKHQKRIAIQTLKMHDIGAMIMGGMSKEEARVFLARIGYSAQQIANLEGYTPEESKALEALKSGALEAMECFSEDELEAAANIGPLPLECLSAQQRKSLGSNL